MNPTALTTTKTSFLPYSTPHSDGLAGGDTPWAKLPEDVIIKLFEYLPYKDARQYILIDKRTCCIMQANSIIPKVFYRQFAPNTAQPILSPHENYQENIRPWLVESGRHNAITRLDSLAEFYEEKPLLFKYELSYAISKLFENAKHHEIKQVTEFKIPTVSTVTMKCIEWYPHEDNALVSYKLLNCSLVHVRKICFEPTKMSHNNHWYSERLQSGACIKVQFHNEYAYSISTKTNLVNQTRITIRCYREYTLECEQQITYYLNVKLCAFNSDASCLTVVLADESIDIFTRDEQNTWQICQKIRSKDATIREVAFSHDNETMLIVCDCLCRFLQINKSKTWKITQIIFFQDQVLSAQFSPNSRSLVIATTQPPSEDNNDSDASFLVHFYSHTPSEWIETQLIKYANKPMSFAFSPNSRHIIIDFNGGEHRYFFFDDDQDQWVEKRMYSGKPIVGELAYRNTFNNHELVRKPTLSDNSCALLKMIAT